ncbi:MAG: hypothetical protein ACJZ84_04195 [Paracoccaceae bacterium]
MIILRIFLYVICITSIGWSVLVFGGPPIIKRLISGFSDGALIPSGITVSPGLDVRISRLEFNFQKEIVGWHIEGFSRSTKIAWSLFGEKPFLEINLGPSLLKGYATADSVNFYTPSFQKIDWKNIAVVANIDTLNLNTFAKTDSLKLTGNLDLESAQVSNVKIDLKKFSAKNGSSTYSANSTTGDVSGLSLNAPLNEQLFSSAFVIEDVIVDEPNLTLSEVIVELSVEEVSRNFKIDLHDVKLSGSGGSIENVKVDGHFNQLNVLEELHVAAADSFPFKKLPKFSEISATVKKSGDEHYEANIKGSLEEFELSYSDNLIGSLPSGNFVIDLEVDRGASKVDSISKINFSTFSAADIAGTFEMGFRSELLTKLECTLADCELSDFDLAYSINFDDEWVRGSANCVKSFCSLVELDHLVRTSNTVNILTILNQAKILNPLSSMYFYGVISSAQKINSGHELKFQF